MNKIYLILIIVSSFIFTSCSMNKIYKIGYVAGKMYQQEECQKEPQPLIDQCMERASKSYEEYKKEREQVL